MALTATPISIAQFEIITVNTDQLVYTVTQPKVIIKEILVANFNDADSRANIAVVPSGETLSPIHYIFNKVKTKKNESRIISGISTVLDTGGTIYIKGDKLDTVVKISAVEFTTI